MIFEADVRRDEDEDDEKFRRKSCKKFGCEGKKMIEMNDTRKNRG